MYNAKTMAKIATISEQVKARAFEELPKMDKEQAAYEAEKILYLGCLYGKKPKTPQGWRNFNKWVAQNAIFWLGYDFQCFLWKFTKKQPKAKAKAKQYWKKVKLNFENDCLAV